MSPGAAAGAPPVWACGPHRLALGRAHLLGILNATPDSFSDGGAYATPHAAVERGAQMLAEGAALIDLGGESTRPGAAPVPPAEELRRVLPVLTGLLAVAPHALVSIDTTKAAVAEAALRAGAVVVNDISGAQADPRMLEVLAAGSAGLVLMHMQGTPATMQRSPAYGDVVGEVGEYLNQRFGAAVAAGIAPERIVLDPGIGFGKTLEHNLALLNAIPALARALPRPLLLGVSRKKFLGTLGGLPEDRQRLPETLAANLALARAGVRLLRVHEPGPLARALRVQQALAPL